MFNYEIMEYRLVRTFFGIGFDNKKKDVVKHYKPNT